MDQESAAAPADGQDTSQESAPPSEDTREATAPSTEETAGESQETIDYEKRYNDLRPEYDRNQQALKEAQQYQAVVEALQSDDPQERAWAADILGLDFQEDEEEGDSDTEDEEFKDTRVDHLLADQERQQHEAYLDQI